MGRRDGDELCSPEGTPACSPQKVRPAAPPPVPECDARAGVVVFFSLLEHCRKHKYLAKTGETFVSLVVRLMERLLDYRTIMHDENKENRMSCTVNVLVSGAFVAFPASTVAL